MFRLEYINTKTTNKWEFIGNFKEERYVHESMAKFLKKHNYTAPYFRFWKDEEGYTKVDFGSHIQFYRFKEIEDSKPAIPHW